MIKLGWSNWKTRGILSIEYIHIIMQCDAACKCEQVLFLQHQSTNGICYTKQLHIMKYLLVYLFLCVLQACYIFQLLSHWYSRHSLGKYAHWHIVVAQLQTQNVIPWDGTHSIYIYIYIIWALRIHMRTKFTRKIRYNTEIQRNERMDEWINDYMNEVNK